MPPVWWMRKCFFRALWPQIFGAHVDRGKLGEGDQPDGTIFWASSGVTLTSTGGSYDSSGFTNAFLTKNEGQNIITKFTMEKSSVYKVS